MQKTWKALAEFRHEKNQNIDPTPPASFLALDVHKRPHLRNRWSSFEYPAWLLRRKIYPPLINNEKILSLRQSIGVTFHWLKDRDYRYVPLFLLAINILLFAVRYWKKCRRVYPVIIGRLYHVLFFPLSSSVVLCFFMRSSSESAYSINAEILEPCSNDLS